METNQNERQENNFLRIAFAVVRQYLLLIISIILVVTIIGTIFANNKKPYYVATEPVSYTAKVNSGTGTVSNYNTMALYLDTVVDFCRQGVVLDRAEFYYGKFKQMGNNADVETLISNVMNNEIGYEYNARDNAKEQRKYYGGTTTVNSYAIEDSVNPDVKIFTFRLSVKDEDPIEAKNKLRVLALAAQKEAINKVDNQNNVFVNVETTIKELIENSANISVGSTVSKKKIITTAFIAGVAISIGVVVLIFIFDKSIKEKRDLEKIAGVPVLAYLEDLEVR